MKIMFWIVSYYETLQEELANFFFLCLCECVFNLKDVIQHNIIMKKGVAHHELVMFYLLNLDLGEIWWKFVA
jgi:hypothetical protein